MNFDAIMAPLGARTFTGEYLGRQPLHLQGQPDKFHRIMNWGVLNQLLDMTTIWSSVSLLLVMDKESLPKESYTSPMVGRDGYSVLRPDPRRVKEHLARGATLVLNDIDQLTPELSTFARELEEALGGKVQANLYLSSKRKQAFRAHFDFHDVFATHVMGEKTWMVFKGMAEHPIKHPAFEGWSKERHEQLKGELWREVRLRPGDLLYLPRGQYHYALADDGPCAHIAWGVTYPIGMDAVTYGFERMIGEVVGRANLPREREALRERLAEIGRTLAGKLAEPQALDDMARYCAAYRWPRDTYDLPGLIERADQAYRVRGAGLKLVSQAGRHGLVKEGTREAVEVPAAIQPQVAWILEREHFGKRELAAAFPAESPAKLDRLMVDLHRMALVEAV
jgi:bifunctional lysine-specific demethylase and histidyl-hydroxylase MINA